MKEHNNLRQFNPDRVRRNLLSYTRKAFHMLPPIVKPRILDIGCGTGVATLELARLSGGIITGVDVEKNSLDRLVSRATEEGLSDRIEVIHASMLDINFPANSFDIIWSEGAIINIGFKRGLSEWRDLLVPEGFLVVHDEMTDLPGKIKVIHRCGYSLLGQIELSPDIWWNEYYVPLEKEIKTVRATGFVDEKSIRQIQKVEQEIKVFDYKNDRFASVFFVLKRTKSGNLPQA